MNFSYKLSLIAVLLIAVASGCTWVKPIEGTEAVALVKPTAAQNCKKLGATEVAVKDNIGPMGRSEKKVSDELLTLARNQAVAMNADTLVSESGVVDGKQRFGLFICR